MMIRKSLLAVVCVIVLVAAWFYIIGKGLFGEDWTPAAATPGPRQQAAATVASTGSQILFGDLHNHTSYSIDALIFGTSVVKGGGVVTPADACDFARYCSALDFWSINDHAESLTPRVWADTVAAMRDCNAQAGDPAHPDMVSYVGWEWSNGAMDDIPSHYGHKNVIFRTWEKGQTPTRPISSTDVYAMARIPAIALGTISLSETLSNTSDIGRYIDEAGSVPTCPDNVSAPDLPADCREVALTPQSLFQKLDQWGFDALVIPHGLAWGTTNPIGADFRNQLDQHEQRYQKLLEIYSGHGNSEIYEDYERIGVDDAGNRYCPPATDNFTPCCQQVKHIVRGECEAPGSAVCAEQVAQAVSAFLDKGDPAGRKTLPDLQPEDWEGCGQLRNHFQPSSQYVNRQSAQYNLALGFDKNTLPTRFKPGLIGSSDGHQARPGSSYKESNRLLYTDHKDVGEGGIMRYLSAAAESGGFYYTGGLVAAHSDGRDRDAIWNALDNRNVYATSGDRMLVWFDLVNGPTGEVPMGSEVILDQPPLFRVKALGAFRQQPGCPERTIMALGEERTEALCGGECYHPGDTRKAITRIEVIKVQPQVKPDEMIAPLIQDPWQVIACPADGSGCEAEFSDPSFSESGRDALYYVRVIQEAELLIDGDPFGCEYNDAGECIRLNYCIGKNATRDKNCLAEAEPRAWSSPIFVEHP